MWPFKYPYTNFHEMNLDWIINEVKANRNQIENINSNIVEIVLDNISAVGGEFAIRSVKEFGAIGDGIHDDSNAFKEALNTNHAIFVPNGFYKISGVTFNKCSLIGEFGGSNYGSRPNTGSVIMSDGNLNIVESSFIGVCFENSKTEYSRSNNFLMNVSSKNNRFENCLFYGYQGVTNFNAIVNFKGCLVSQCRYGLYGMIDSEFTDGYIYSCDTGAALPTGANANRIANNKIEWCGIGLDISSASHNIVTGNVIDRCSDVGCRIQEVDALVMKSNVIMRCANHNIELVNVRNSNIDFISVYGNSMDDGSGAEWPTQSHLLNRGGYNNIVSMVFKVNAAPAYNIETPMINSTFVTNTTDQTMIPRMGVFSSAWKTTHRFAIALDPYVYRVIELYSESGNHRCIAGYNPEGAFTISENTYQSPPKLTYADGVLTVVLDEANFLTVKYM